MDPHQDPSYLLSTIQVIADSQYDQSSASIHNLLDAYTTFINRIRSQSHPLQIGDTSLPALVPLGIHKDSLARALRRDVRLAHLDPFSDETTLLGIDTKQYARDSSSLCHHALCVLTTIFRFPALYSAFSEHDLSSLFGDVLDIALADHLPVLNEPKTYSLSLWALGCHRLPVSVIRSRERDVFSALHQSLDAARQPDSIVLDGVKALSHTIEHYPFAALDLLFPLIPHVITNLNCKSSQHRFHASLALGKFANALIRQTELSLANWHSLSNHIVSFLESFCDDSMVALGNTSFASMVRATFSPEAHPRHTDAPARILAVLASLIILCGPTLYRKPTVLQFILQSLALALTHKRSVVRALHPHVWKCFVWTFSQMLLSPENVEPALVSSAFYVIKQEVRGGIGIALVAVLLSDQMSTTERGDRVSQALSVIKAMVRTECKHTRQEGFMFLQAFTDDPHVRHRVLHDICQIPASILLDGAIFRAEWDGLPSIIHSVPKVTVSVRWLEETEIARHYKTTLAIWKHFVNNAGGKSLDSGLVDVWLAILRACSHQLECEQHTTAVSEMLRYMATMIVDFLPPAPSGDSQPDWGSWDVHDQLCSLTNADQLWSAMRRAFLVPSLAEVAELILASVLKYAFHILDLDVRTLWGRLCADLMMTAPPSFLQDAHRPTSQLVIRSQRELWGVVATSISSSELAVDWHELAKFLSIPICTWVLSNPELEAWEALLRNAITISGDPAIVIDHIVSQYFQEKEVETWNSILPILGLLLTCEHGNSPSDKLLFTVDICLTVYYNQARHSPETLTHSLKLLDVIRHMIASAPEIVIRILQALRGSLCLWVSDHNEVMSDDEFNSVAVSLYCEALRALEILPLSVQSLQITESFLAAAFSRIPMPAIAPFAFEKFWRATYHGRTQFCNSLPPKIKSCLSCFVAAYGGDLADGLSLSNGSQSQTISNSSQLHSRIYHQLQDPSELGLLVTSISIETREEGETELHESPLILTGQDDITFLCPDDDPLEPTVLRQLQEYTSQIDSSSLDGPELSMSSRRILSSPVLPPDCAMRRSRSPEKNHPVASYPPNRKRKLADNDNAPQKRSRTARGTLRLVRKLESEPATRDVTPVDVPRTNSVPPTKRNVFDGVQVPTLREISRQKAAQKAECVINAAQGRSCVRQTPSSRSARRKSRTPQSPLPSSVGSDDDLDWEDFHLDGSSESDVDRSLTNGQPSSPLPTQTSVPHGRSEYPSYQTRPVDSEDVVTGSSPPKAMSQNGCSPSAPSLQRPKARLDALRDVYSSVANGASQIPLPELVQATKLVHQIGAVLTEQMGKKMGNSR